jgi:hypothetical protein
MTGSRSLFITAILVGLTACSNEGPVVGASRDGQIWFRYEATFLYFAEQPEGVRDCGDPFFHGVTSGYLGERPGVDAGARTLHWEGMGCDISVQGPPGGPFTATTQPCRPGPDPELAGFGVETVVLDELLFEPSGGGLNAKGRITRVRDGQRSTLCFEIPDGT